MSQAALEVMQRVQAADRAGALDLAIRFLARGERHPLILMLAAERLEETGQTRQALALLRDATAQTQDEPELWRRYGVALGQQGFLPQAREALARAHALLPDQPAILLPLATACYRLGELEAADGHYARAAALVPDSIEPVAARAMIAIQRGDMATGRDLAARALTHDPANVTASIARGHAMLGEGDAQGAEAMATALLARLGRKSEHRLALLSLRADARDRLGRAQDAFLDYMMRNSLLVSQYRPIMTAAGMERQVDRARRIAAWLDRPAAGPAADGREPAPARPCAGHLFIMGFPRSGTTLLEKALSGHDRVRTLPEIDCLAEAGADLLASDDGMDRLATLPPAERAALRARYFAAAERATGALPGKVLVDKLPLHSIALPLIARLFPDAKIVLSLRDPRDVVLSGFRRRFQMNGAMFELLTPLGAAQFYEAVMTLVERGRIALALDLHEVRHEDLVDDFEGQVRRVLALVGLDWSERVRAFPERAAAHARTPSDYQLRRGLNRDGIGSWRRYEAQLQPVMPILEPWVRRWGY